MLVIKLKITRHVKKWENSIHNEKNNQKVEIALELPQMLELAKKKNVKISTTVFIVMKANQCLPEQEKRQKE